MIIININILKDAAKISLTSKQFKNFSDLNLQGVPQDPLWNPGVFIGARNPLKSVPARRSTETAPGAILDLSRALVQETASGFYKLINSGEIFRKSVETLC